IANDQVRVTFVDPSGKTLGSTTLTKDGSETYALQTIRNAADGDIVGNTSNVVDAGYRALLKKKLTLVAGTTMVLLS
ncbi:hypothetical protein, partial [Lentilactobacillus kisonensis]|uniref:hypothetical protein n=1 Tax=Lentilactobacillus kisonensis TaxID=481722 RepID=UPI000B28CAF6